MNKALIPAFFLLGSLILGVTVIVPQFTSAQGEEKVNEKQMEALNLFFNGQNLQKTTGNEQTETLNSQSSDVSSSLVSQQGKQQQQEEEKVDDSSSSFSSPFSTAAESQLNLK